MVRDTHLNFLRLLFTLVGKDDLSFYYKQQSTANSNSFKCAEKLLVMLKDDYVPQVR